ncbi:MAG: hypothetical protein ACR2MK_02915 [Solirubrobacteraceae bacterium]
MVRRTERPGDAHARRGAWLLVGLPVIAARIWWSAAAAIAVFVVTVTMYVAAAVRYMHRHRPQP